jgi:hypothetical protein
MPRRRRWRRSPASLPGESEAAQPPSNGALVQLYDSTRRPGCVTFLVPASLSYSHLFSPSQFETGQSAKPPLKRAMSLVSFIWLHCPTALVFCKNQCAWNCHLLSLFACAIGRSACGLRRMSFGSVLGPTVTTTPMTIYITDPDLAPEALMPVIYGNGHSQPEQRRRRTWRSPSSAAKHAYETASGGGVASRCLGRETEREQGRFGAV